MNVDLNEISVFLRVVQAGSFTKAGKLLGMPISTVSARVASLEKRLGVTLLQRTTRQLKLTDPGRRYYEHCLLGLDEIYKAEIDVISDQSEPHGTLKVTAPVFLGNSLLPDIISDCLKKYPGIHLEIILKDRSMDLIADGIDVAIRAGDLKDSSLIARKLGTVQFALFASPGYLKNKESIKHPKDLKNHDCLQFTPLGQDEWFFTNGRSRVNVPIAGKVIIDELHLVKTLAVSGKGVALLPTFICEEEVNKGRLVPVLEEWKSISRQIQLVHLPQKYPSPKIKAFIDIATKAIQKKLSFYSS